MKKEWQITSRISDIFEPAVNPITSLIHAIQKTMNSNVLFLKGEISLPLNQIGVTAFGTFFMRNGFNDLFYDYDRLSNKYDYHDWADTEESKTDFFKGYKPRTDKLMKPNVYIKMRPISYLAFLEKLHWMLRTSFSPYSTHLEEVEALKLISDFTKYTFTDEKWDFQTTPQVWQGIPNWIPHAWAFYDIVPDFLYSTGYWEHNEVLSEAAYFDGGSSDSCTFFYMENIFYILLTNGSP